MYDLRALATQRGFEIVHEYTDRISGAKAKRPGLDQLLADARRGKFQIVLCWAFDRIARSTRHFLEVLDELNHENIEFISFRENVDTSGPLGRAMVVIIGAIAELERNLIIERVRAGCGVPASKVSRSAGLHCRLIALLCCVIGRTARPSATWRPPTRSRKPASAV